MRRVSSSKPSPIGLVVELDRREVEAAREDQVERPLTEHPVGDVDVAAPGVARVGALHGEVVAGRLIQARAHSRLRRVDSTDVCVTGRRDA